MIKFFEKHSYIVPVLLFAILSSGLQNIYAQKIKNSSAYFSKKSNIGIFIKTELDHSGHGGGGLIGAAITAGVSSGKSKYDEPLKYLQPQVDPAKRLADLYKDIYSKKGKIVTILPDNADSIKFKDFDATNAGPGKHYRKDVRFFKEKYGIDELLIIKVDYGISIGYSYGIEIRRDGICNINTNLVNLTNNIILIKDNSGATAHINGDWNTPPDYLNLKNCILTAVDLATQSEQEKYFPSPK